MELVEDRVVNWMGDKPIKARVRRWRVGNGVTVHLYRFYSAPYTVPLRTVHLVEAREKPQIVIFEWG